MIQLLSTTFFTRYPEVGEILELLVLVLGRSVRVLVLEKVRNRSPLSLSYVFKLKSISNRACSAE